MKDKIKKLSESTAAKILAATIVPGGFLMWGAYELGKFVESRKQRSTGDDTDQSTVNTVQDGPVRSEVSVSESDSDKKVHDKDESEGDLDETSV